jgi:hypothetical protein
VKSQKLTPNCASWASPLAIDCDAYQGGVMRINSSHWLDYDPIALIVLMFGIGAVALLAVSI